MIHYFIQYYLCKKIMQKILKIFLFMLLLPSLSIYADDNNEWEDVILIQRNPSNHPNSGQIFDDFIQCHYYNGFMVFELTDSMNSATILITTPTKVYIYIISMENNFIKFPNTQGFCTIECLIDDGREYSGTIIL